MKNILVTVILFLIIMYVSGCGYKVVGDFETTISMGGLGADDTYNDIGVFNSERGIVYYCDPETGIRTPICTKINCMHQGISPSNPSSDCDAYFSTFINCTAVVGNNLYAVCSPEDEGLFVKEFIKADKDGTNRKTLYRTENVCYFGSGIYEGGYFVYSFYNQEDTDGIKLKKNKIGIIIINLDNEEVTRVDLEDAYSGKILTANVVGNCIYYMLSYNTEDLSDYDYDYITSQNGSEKFRDVSRLEIWKYDIKSGEADLYDRATSDNTRYLLGFGYILKGYDEDKRYELIDIKTGDITVIDGVDLKNANIAMFDEGILFNKNDQVKLLRYGSGYLEKIRDYSEEFISINWITKRWVYGYVYTEDGYMDCVWPREKFLSGNFEWREIDLGYSN